MSGSAWQTLHLSLGHVIVTDVVQETAMARYRIEYRDKTGEHVMLIDDRDRYHETLTERQRAVWHAALEWLKERT